MSKAFSQKHPYLASVLAALLCIFLTAIGSAIPQILELGTDISLIIMTASVALSAVVGLIIMNESRFSFFEYGFRSFEKSSLSKVWWLIPLLLVEIVQIIAYGFSTEVTLVKYIILLLFVIAVGINEEIYFRGIILKFMGIKGVKRAIFWSALIFGVGHLSIAFSKANIIYVLLVILFAFFVGLVLAQIVSTTKSLWIVIVWHASHNYISEITGDSLDLKAIIVLAVQLVILLIYTIGIWAVSTKVIDEDNHNLVQKMSIL
jgi:membrane protease YdiL (CAAX protease family)